MPEKGALASVFVDERMDMVSVICLLMGIYLSAHCRQVVEYGVVDFGQVGFR